MSATEQLDNILDSLNKRISDPFLGSYILLFFTFNYEIILIFFSGEKVEKKLALISDILNKYIFLDFKGLKFGLNPAILTPLLFALIYCFLYPYIYKKIFKITENHRVDVENIKTNSQENLVQIEERISKFNEELRIVRTESSQLLETIKNKDLLISNLQNDFNKLTKNNSDLSAQIAAQTKKDDANKNAHYRVLALELDALDLDEDLVLPPREYKLKKGNLTSAAVLDRYHHSLLQISSDLEAQLENSKSAKDNFSSFRNYLNGKNYNHCIHYLEQASAIPSLTPDEKFLIRAMIEKIREIEQFTR